MADNEPKKSSLKKFASVFKPMGADNYNKVLASSYEQRTGKSADYDPVTGQRLTTEQKAKLLVAQRDAASPSGVFVLSDQKGQTQQGYGNYFTSMGAVPADAGKKWRMLDRVFGSGA